MALAFALLASFFPISSDVGATGVYYYFGFPFTSLTLKHGTMGNPAVMNSWFVIPDTPGIMLDILTWLSGFELLIFLIGLSRRVLERRHEDVHEGH
jgi:hypothetical protein